MTITELNNQIASWSTWAAKEDCKRFDIALFKIWTQVELYCSELFVQYCIGTASERGYAPCLKIHFKDEEQLNAFLREGSKKYVDYIPKIESLSKHIFDSNPFDIMLVDQNYKQVCEQVKSIRNYVAHESSESKRKYINSCLGGRETKFIEPNEYLLKKERSSNTTYFAYYTRKLSEMAELLISQPE